MKLFNGSCENLVQKLKNNSTGTENFMKLNKINIIDIIKYWDHKVPFLPKYLILIKKPETI